MFRSGLVLWEALLGDRASAAREHALSALRIFRGRDTDYGPALALVLAGDSAQGLAIARELAQRYPEDTSVRFKYVPAIEAMAALEQRLPRKAIDITLRAAPYEFGQTGASLFGFHGTMDPVYIRGLAYAKERQYATAAAEF